MTQEIIASTSTDPQAPETIEALPFPFQQHTFCRYEPVEKHINEARVLIVDDLLRDENDLSPVAQRDWAGTVGVQLKRERQIAQMAIENIRNNVERLVKNPVTEIACLADLTRAESEF